MNYTNGAHKSESTKTLFAKIIKTLDHGETSTVIQIFIVLWQYIAVNPKKKKKNSTMHSQYASLKHDDVHLRI